MTETVKGWLIAAAIVVGIFCTLVVIGLSAERARRELHGNQPPCRVVLCGADGTPTREWKSDGWVRVSSEGGASFYVDGRRVWVSGSYTIEPLE